jgi:hypothetical protein
LIHEEQKITQHSLQLSVLEAETRLHNHQQRKMATIAGKGVKKKIKMSFIQKEQT